jgi:hypothetical protein
LLPYPREIIRGAAERLRPEAEAAAGAVCADGTMSPETLYQHAKSVLERNWTGSATLPSPAQYPHQWSWDSAFAAIGWAHIDPARARTELSSLFAGQWASGRVPHIQFHPDVDEAAYFPGPSFWHSAANPDAPSVATSGIIQPPVHARAVWHVFRSAPDSDEARAFLADMYPRLAAWHSYLRTERDLGGVGLAAIVHPWESGMDNSPLWDAVLKHSDHMRHQGFIRRDTINVDASQRPSDRDYEHYVALASSYRDRGYDDAQLAGYPFIVEDPLFNSVLLDAERCLGQIADLLGHDAAGHEDAARALSEAMNAVLWNEERGVFGGRDVVGEAPLSELTIGSLAPLLDPWLPADRRHRTLAFARSDAFTAGCAYPLPTMAATSPQFNRVRYWRGPMWASTNWLIWVAARIAGDRALADVIARSTVEAARRSGFREYYDPVSGDGLGARDFSWSAALVLDLLPAIDAGAP